MAKEKDELTPMMRQYQDIKKEHQDKVLFFRLGDFYEMFNEDAVEVSHLLNLTLTHRGKVPMCGIPYHAAGNYLKRLLDAGCKVAVCEQLTLPDNPRELAKREVVQIFTPGTVIDDEYLDSFKSNYILSVGVVKGEFCLAYADITTGDFCVKRLRKDDRLTNLTALINTLELKEIIIGDDLYFTDRKLKSILDESGVIITKVPLGYFNASSARKSLLEQFSAETLKGFGFEDNDSLLPSAGALLRYLKEMLKSSLPQIKNVRIVSDEGFLILDEATEKNLELVKNLNDGKSSFTLFSALNRTRTSAGSRLLSSVILNPLSDKAKIEERLDWCEYLTKEIDERRRVRAALSSSSDLVRLTSKFEMKRSVPRDLIAVKETLKCFFALASENERYLELLDKEIEEPESLVSITELIESSINPECTSIYHEGAIIKDGFDEELDRLRGILNHSSELLSAYLEKVKGETGLTILKLGENRIIGYYLEVPKGQLSRVPESFIRRQTLVGGERFTTDELSELERSIRGSEAEAVEKEKAIYNQIIESVRVLSTPLRSIGSLLAQLDLYQSFAEVSATWDYRRPEILPPESDMVIKAGRHPVVEQHLDRGLFVSNDYSSIDSRFALITGPNMAGKSTFLRQSALIVLMAHIGIFVPAEEAHIPLTDRIFCRVGASDNLARGESTFLVEMQESSYILRNATSSSLVVMDEIGRGTSTQDGMSIAYAIMQYLFRLNAITLFATHYHELTMLDTSGMDKLTLEVVENKKDIVFVRKVIKGVAASSYGLHVAKLAGIPQSVIRMASSFQKQHFADYQLSESASQLDLFVDTAAIKEDEKSSLLDEISDFDISSSTPLEALMLISQLQKKISDSSKK